MLVKAIRLENSGEISLCLYLDVNYLDEAIHTREGSLLYPKSTDLYLNVP
jgi:hypothetical protein